MADLEETSKGCCGSGTIEYGDACRGMKTCEDASKYAFWDAVHPTEKMYQIVAEEAMRSLNEALLRWGYIYHLPSYVLASQFIVVFCHVIIIIEVKWNEFI